ncbi:MAG: PQ-loop repeat-containing protein [Nitrosomonadaceae bacterium]|nr:PQ-loop repeat-containing protein [Nitrosomonadaceae bacterium]
MITFLGVLTFLLLNCSTVPQILKTIKTRQVEDISFTAYALATFGFAVALLYCYLTAAPVWLIVNYVVGLVLDIIMLVLLFKYRQKL